MSATFYVGDVFDVLRTLPDASVDFACWSPPFLALRSYLPPDHPDKAREIGSEPTPAAWLDSMLAVTAEVGRVLAPHGSIAVEIGDTYAGSGGAGGDYAEGGLRDGQQRFDGSASRAYGTGRAPRPPRTGRGLDRRSREAEGIIPHQNGWRAPRDGWPLAKSLTGLPTLFAWSLAYGRNLLTGRQHGHYEGGCGMCRQSATHVRIAAYNAGDPVDEWWAEEHPVSCPTCGKVTLRWVPEQWRVRNLRPWVRPNPPVGSLGDKVRPATSYVTVACRSEKRWHDLDAVRRQPQHYTPRMGAHLRTGIPGRAPQVSNAADGNGHRIMSNPAGGPPNDWQHPVDEVLRAALASDKRTPRDLRIALERAGWLDPIDGYDLPPGGFKGQHYAVWPAELVGPMVDELCPRRVCRTCGEPSRRVTGSVTLDAYRASERPQTRRAVEMADAAGLTDAHIAAVRATGPNDAGKALVVNNGAGKNSEAVKALAAEAKAVLGGYFREFVTTGNATTTTTGWSSCGCTGTTGLRLDGYHTGPGWRPGVVLDPFAGSGTTLEVATGRGRDAIGIDLDERNADLARQRLGFFLEVVEPVVRGGEVA